MRNTNINKIRNLTMAGIMTALITIMTAYICHVPVGINGGYIHFGDAIIYLTATLLPAPYAIAAAAIGGGLADLLTAPMWILPTIIIKMLIVIPFSSKTKKIISKRNILATVIAYFISGFGYLIAEYLIFETIATVAISLLQSLIQSAGSALFFIIIGSALDKANIKSKIMLN